MKHFRILLSLLILALLLSGCGNTAREPYMVSLDGNRVVTIHPAAGTIQYGSDVYRYHIKSVWGDTRYELTYPDGRRYVYTESKKDGASSWSEDITPSLYLPGELLIRALKQPTPETPAITREKTGNPVLGIFASLAGILLMVFHKRRADPDNPRKFVAFGNSNVGVEISPEEYAGITFVAGVFALIYGLCQFFF